MDITLSNHKGPSPTPLFNVYSASGRLVGYGSMELGNVYEVYLPGGDDERFMGLVSGADVEFSSGVLAGRIERSQIFYGDGERAGEIKNREIFDEDGHLIATTEGDGTPEAHAGAALLLIMCRWLLADGSPNPDVR